MDLKSAIRRSIFGMKTAVIIILIVSLAGNLIGAYLLYKVLKLREEVRLFQKYHSDLLAKYEAAKSDFAGIATYAEDNKRLLRETTPEERKKMAVLFGASITKSLDVDKYLPGMRVINRGVGSQIYSQLLGRFASDVLELGPGKVVIKFCGVNFFPDYDQEAVWNQFEMMAVSASERGIVPILGTTLPITRAGDKFEKYGATDKIKIFNDRLKKFAGDHNFPVVDYYSALADEGGFLPDSLARDELHPNEKGCGIMAKTVRQVLE